VVAEDDVTSANTQDPEADVDAPARRSTRRAVSAVLSLLLGITLVVAVLPAIADFNEVGAAIGDMSALQITVLLLLAAWNILTYLFVMMAALPGLKIGHAFLVSQMSTAVANTIPAGAVAGVGVTYALLYSYGHESSSIAVAALATGVWNTFVKLGLPLVALAVLALSGGAPGALVTAAVFGVLVLAGAVGMFGLILYRESTARSIGNAVGRGLSAIRRVVHRPPLTTVGDSFVRFRSQIVGLVEHRWYWITATTVLSHLSLFLLLLLSLRFVGVPASDVSFAEALGAFAFVRLITALPVTPGGLGVVELGMTAALVVAGGDESLVVAGVLVYRALSYGLQVVLGMISFIIWRAKRPEPPAAASASSDAA